MLPVRINGALTYDLSGAVETYQTDLTNEKLLKQTKLKRYT
jgi:hypothetical protein